MASIVAGPTSCRYSSSIPQSAQLGATGRERTLGLTLAGGDGRCDGGQRPLQERGAR